MKPTWILACEAAHAKLLVAESSRGALSELEVFVHPASRAKGSELASDRQGRSFDSHGTGRHAMDATTEARRYEATVFARELSERLEQARQRNEYERLYLIAAPEFLGLLRKTLPAPVRNLVVGEIKKNLVKQDNAAIRSQLPEYL